MCLHLHVFSNQCLTCHIFVKKKNKYWRICFFFTELAVTLEAQHGTESATAAGGNNSDYLDLAKKGGGHTGVVILAIISYDKIATVPNTIV